MDSQVLYKAVLIHLSCLFLFDVCSCFVYLYCNLNLSQFESSKFEIMSSYATPGGLVSMGVAFMVLGIVVVALRFHTTLIGKMPMLWDDW